MCNIAETLLEADCTGYSEYCEERNTLYIVMEKGDTDLSTFFKSRTKTGMLTQNTICFYWEQMLTAVQVLHKEGETCLLVILMYMYQFSYV